MSGFGGDRDAGLGMILTCQQEGGLLAPWAAASFMHYTLDTKTFVGEQHTPDDLAACRRLLDWGSSRFPDSPFFALGAADLAATEQDCTAARAVCVAVRPRVGALPALDWLFNWKEGLYGLTRLDWAGAARSFAQSTQIYVKVGRRSMVPYVAMQAATSFLAASEELLQAGADTRAPPTQPEAEHTAEEVAEAAVAADTVESLRREAVAMLELVGKYLALDKDNWGRQDTWAFRQLGKYDIGLRVKTPEAGPGGKAAHEQHAKGRIDRAEAEQRLCSGGGGTSCSTPWALLDLAESMVISLRCVRWMADEAAAGLSSKLQSRQIGWGPDEQARAALVCGELAAGRGGETGRAECLAHCARGLALQPAVSPAAARQGIAPYLHYIVARELTQRGDFHSGRAAAAEAAHSNTAGLRLEKVVTFKLGVLTQMIDAAVAAAFTTLAIHARSTAVVALSVAAGVTASWEFTLEQLDVNFRVEWLPNEGEMVIVRPQQKMKAAAPTPTVRGEFVAPSDGVVRLVWDNTFSMLRGKTVLYRTTPAAR